MDSGIGLGSMFQFLARCANITGNVDSPPIRATAGFIRELPKIFLGIDQILYRIEMRGGYLTHTIRYSWMVRGLSPKMSYSLAN